MTANHSHANGPSGPSRPRYQLSASNKRAKFQALTDVSSILASFWTRPAYGILLAPCLIRRRNPIPPNSNLISFWPCMRACFIYGHKNSAADRSLRQAILFLMNIYSYRQHTITHNTRWASEWEGWKQATCAVSVLEIFNFLRLHGTTWTLALEI
jgi:hypothetical protein